MTVNTDQPAAAGTLDRRAVTRTIAWGAPAVAVALAAPATAASTPPVPGQYGTLVAVPWDNTWAGGRFNGTASGLQPWVMYPTSRPLGTYEVTNDTTPQQVGDPLIGNSVEFPSIYPSTDAAYNGNGQTDPNGVGRGDIVTITIEALGGQTTYADTPQSAKNVAGANAWPTVVMRDYRPDAPGSYYDFIAVDSSSASGTDIGRGTEEFTGVADATTAPTTWTWQIHLTNPVDNQHDGSDAVTFDVRYPAIRGGVAEQYRTTVTSPWGTVVYTSPAV